MKRSLRLLHRAAHNNKAKLSVSCLLPPFSSPNSNSETIRQMQSPRSVLSGRKRSTASRVRQSSKWREGGLFGVSGQVAHAILSTPLAPVFPLTAQCSTTERRNVSSYRFGSAGLFFLQGFFHTSLLPEPIRSVYNPGGSPSRRA